MTAGKTTGWQDTLSEIEHAIGNCLAVLNKYEAAFAQLLQAEGVAAGAVTDSDRDWAWVEKLNTAGRSAADAERLLAEQEAVWGKWRDALADWQRLADVDRK
jgi:DNA-binding SARP family transcriptional activator